MSRTHKDSKKTTGRGRQRHISVRAVRRDPPDLRKLSRALIAIAMAEAEAEKQAHLPADSAANRTDGTTPDDPDREVAS
jgi:hypothetical protein